MHVGDGYVRNWAISTARRASVPSGCVDWTTTFEPEWTISVDPGDTGSAYFNIRDSHPGDFCWIGDLDRKELRNGQTTLLATHANGPLADDGPLPIAVIDACGPEYADDAYAMAAHVVAHPWPRSPRGSRFS